MKLKELRKAKNFSQKEIADYLSSSVTVYSRYETGTREPSIDVLIKLADFYNVTLDELVGRRPLEPVTVYADPPPAPEGFASIVIAEGKKGKATPDALEKQIRTVLTEELKKRGL